MLATQAMVAMGKVSIPGQAEMKVDLVVAKHFIDLLGMLEEKIKGEFTSDEVGTLAAIAHEVRSEYLAAKK